MMYWSDYLSAAVELMVSQLGVAQTGRVTCSLSLTAPPPSQVSQVELSLRQFSLSSVQQTLTVSLSLTLLSAADQCVDYCWINQFGGWTLVSNCLGLWTRTNRFKQETVCSFYCINSSSSSSSSQSVFINIQLHKQWGIHCLWGFSVFPGVFVSFLNLFRWKLICHFLLLSAAAQMFSVEEMSHSVSVADDLSSRFLYKCLICLVNKSIKKTEKRLCPLQVRALC